MNDLVLKAAMRLIVVTWLIVAMRHVETGFEIWIFASLYLSFVAVVACKTSSPPANRRNAAGQFHSILNSFSFYPSDW